MTKRSSRAAFWKSFVCGCGLGLSGMIPQTVAVAQDDRPQAVPTSSSEPAPMPGEADQAALPVDAEPHSMTTPPGPPVPCQPFPAQPMPVYTSPYEGNLWERSTLVGDVGGLRTGLLESGVKLDISTTQFYQGIASGGIEQKFNHVGRNDYILNVDGEKAGLWRGLFITLHGETRYGDGINRFTGAIMPVNTASLFPAPTGDQSALTAVKVTQALSEEFVTFAGKINMLDELSQPYAGGRGVDAFMNTGLAFPVASVRSVPYSTLGAGFAVLQDLHPVFSMMVLDTNNTPTTTGFETFFDNGATVISKLDIPVELLGRPGHQGIWGTYSSGTYNDLSPTAYIDPNYGPVLVPAGVDTGSWSLFYSADQALYVDPNDPRRTWGVFTNIGLSDDAPSPVRWSANVGVGGSSPLRSRPLDTFGVGYAYTAYSTPVQTLAPFFLPVRNDEVVELFYNVAVTKWCRVTPNLQILVPAREQTLPPGIQPIDTAVVFGLRAKVDF
jgi:porin